MRWRWFDHGLIESSVVECRVSSQNSEQWGVGGGHNSFKFGLVTKSPLIFLYYSYVQCRHIRRGLSEIIAKPIRSKKKISVHRVICVVARQTTMAIQPSSDSMPLKSRAPMDLCSSALDISPTRLLSNHRQHRSSRSRTPPSV